MPSGHFIRTEEHKRNISLSLKGRTLPRIPNPNRNKIWELANSERRANKRRDRYVRDRESAIIKARTWNLNNPEKSKEFQRNCKRRVREKKYGVSYPTWWLCDLCSKPISLWKGQICLDHDHKTGKFRGWLCDSCNTFLGSLERRMSFIGKVFLYIGEKK